MAEKILKTHIVLRNDLAAIWAEKNPVLRLGEMGIETDTNRIKIGDGKTAWKSLSYVTVEDTLTFTSN